MLTPPLAHAGVPVQPHDVWTTWNLDPTVMLGLFVITALYWRGARRGGRQDRQRRDRAFWLGMLAVIVALVSPLEPLAGAIASGHMVQHVVLILVAAPLLARSAPASTILRGGPSVLRSLRGRVRRRAPGLATAMRAPSHPALVWPLHVAALWLWHSATAYDLAVENLWWHAVEHASFLVTGVWFWRLIVGPRRTRRVPEGLALLLVFGMTLQSVFLSLLLTFSREAWYDAYATTTAAWGLTPLADQQLAGVLMWVPAGAVYLAVALTVFARWIRGAGPPTADTDQVGAPAGVGPLRR